MISFLRFLGSVYFAVILLALLAAVVIAGTFLESSSGSHAYAEQFTYGHPLFSLLICGFFLNILFASLRRWPFQTQHIPFLITHLGLLMLLAGVLAKNLLGVQGVMALVEGSGSHLITLPNQAVVHVESRTAPSTDWLLVRPLIGHPYFRLISQPTLPYALTCLHYAPHSKERLELWTKGNWLSIEGLPRLPVTSWQPGMEINDDRHDPWVIQAFQTQDIQALAHEVYLQDLELQLADRTTDQILLKHPLKNVLGKPKDFSGGTVTAQLNLPLSIEHTPELLITLAFRNRQAEKLRIPLGGPNALSNENLTTPHLGALPIIAELQGPNKITFIHDSEGNDVLFAVDPRGRVHHQFFQPQALKSVYVIDEGYGGYAIQAALPVENPLNFKEREAKWHKQLEQALRTGVAHQDKLAPPLVMLAKACKTAHVDFPSTCLQLLIDWNSSGGWLYSSSYPVDDAVKKALDQLNWSQAPKGTRNCCRWADALSQPLEERLLAGENLAEYLVQGGWPLILPEDLSDSGQTLHTVHQQLFQLAGQLPECPPTEVHEARLFSAYLRTYGLHLSQLDREDIEEETPFHYLHCAVTASHEEVVPTTQIEELTPLIELQLNSGKDQARLTLTYDRTGNGLKWPLNGKFLARFQPLRQEIPYHVRLRDARKISYPNSTQPFSYEADVMVTDRRDGTAVETTLSMNRVHETLDGYRFYLSSLSPDDETAVRSVQLAVNHDPAKYFLTYPGGLILSLGILLLFWFRR